MTFYWPEDALFGIGYVALMLGLAAFVWWLWHGLSEPYVPDERIRTYNDLVERHERNEKGDIDGP